MQTDVAIVGGGPAGCWSAYHLAHHGARVAIIDGSHPREKPCGGGVPARAYALVADALPVANCPVSCVRTVRFVDSIARSNAAVVALHAESGADPPDLIVASRREFDTALLEAACHAGATQITSRAVDVARDGAGFLITTTSGRVRASHLVGADGANSLVRRRLARPFDRADLSIATGYFAHGVRSTEVVLEMTSRPRGYIWSFPRPGHLAIGICAQADEGYSAAFLRETTLQWIQRTGIAAGARLEPYSWPIPSLSAAGFGALVTSGPGWFLVGDAAGLVDPLTREGIYYALLSGQWASDAIAADGRGTSRPYRERVHDEIAGELARAARYKAGFFAPRFLRLMLDAVRSSAAVRAVVADLIAGRQGYRDLKWRLAKTLELGLAWRLLRPGGSGKWYNHGSKE